ncbi:hypothetical protein [Sphingobacterium detergens]|uniref:hypothetical protein n=1 Tax=Sphingobacterium detergens TaxID=1145106 RepID=UPI003AB0775B
MGDNCKHCCPTCGKSLTEEQTQTNRQIVVPVAALSDLDLAIESGAVPPDTTLDEWLNRPVNQSISIVEYGDNA